MLKWWSPSPLLFLYFQYVFVTELTVDNTKTIHEQLSKYLMSNLKPGADPAVVNDLMKVVWHLISFETLFTNLSERWWEKRQYQKIHTILGAK